METKVREVSPVQREFEIHAGSDELEPLIEEQLKKRKSNVKMKGFREGKVPLSLVRKMHGDQVAASVVEDYVKNAFAEEVYESDEYTVLGQPETTELDYEPFGDLRAVVRFDTPPEFDLEDLEDIEISKLVHEVTDDEVEDEIERQLTDQADLIPKEGAAEESDYVRVDMQTLDCESGTPVVGDKEEDVEFFLDDPRVMDELQEAVVGLAPGESARVDLEPPSRGPQQGGGEMDCFEVTVQAVKERDLPPLDENFVREATDGELEDVDEFREALKTRMQESWDQRSSENLDRRIIEEMCNRHPIPVPDGMVERYLDSYVENVKRRNDGDLPEDFDETAFRQNNRGEAEQQARWRFIRDKVAEKFEVEVTSEDFESYYEMQSGEDIDKGQLRQYIESMPAMKEQVENRLLTEKVLDRLKEVLSIEEKDREQLEQEFEQRRAEQQAQESTSAEGEEDASGIVASTQIDEE